MQNPRNEVVSVIFGGRSSEHEVSIITGHQIMDALRVAGYRLLPIYITKDGRWYAGPKLHNITLYSSKTLSLEKIPGVQPVSLSPDRSIRELLQGKNRGWSLFRSEQPMWADVFFPAVHGTMGEDGTLQGLLELADVPYVGCGVLASALGMDKVRAKALFRDAGIAVLDCISINRTEWQSDPTQIISAVESTYEYPSMVKPVCGGSSIGVTRCQNRPTLQDAIELALILDQYALVEKALSDFIEINCSVIGPPAKASVCEQPVSSEQLLSFDDKYKRSGKNKSSAKGGMASLQRIVPAPIDDDLRNEVQQVSVKAFETMGASGLVRIDFLYDNSEGKLFLNEINTMPGSLAFYLWEASGVPFDELVHNLIVTALDQYRERAKTRFTFEANLLMTQT